MNSFQVWVRALSIRALSALPFWHHEDDDDGGDEDND